MLIMLYGDDAFRVKERVRELIDKFEEKHDPMHMNFDEISFSRKEDARLDRLMEMVNAAPFMAQKRMVRVDGILTVTTTKREAELWMQFLSRIPESTIVMMVDVLAVEKVEKLALAKQLFSVKDVHRYFYSLLSGTELQVWVQQRAKFHGAILVPSVIDALLYRTKNDSWRLETEIAKLAAYAAGAPITEEMIQKITPQEFIEDIFGFTDLIMGRDSGFALRKLSEERAAGAQEFPLFGMLVKQIRLCLQAKIFVQDNPQVSKNELAAAFDIHPFVAQKALGAAKRSSWQTIQRWHLLAGNLDFAMKRGLPPKIAVDRLVAALLDAS